MSVPARMAAVAVSAALVLAGCSDDGDDEETRGSGSWKGSGPSLDEGYSVKSTLAEVPKSVVGDGPLHLQSADLRAATEAVGADLPEDGSRDASIEWLASLTNDPEAPVFVPLAESFNLQAASPDEFAEVVGWSVLDVESFVEYSLPPSTFSVVTGDFDDNTLSSDLVEVGDGIVSDREGEDHELDPANINAVNPLGRPTRFARQGDRIALSASTPAVESWLGDGNTLADDDSLVEVAVALDDEDVLSAVLVDVEGGGDPAALALGERGTPEQLEALRDELDAQVPQDPFDAVGIGWAEDDGQALVHAVYHFESSSAAEDGAGVLEAAYREGVSTVTGAPYSDRMSVEEVETDGSTVTVTVTPTDQGGVADLYQALQQRESLFLSR